MKKIQECDLSQFSPFFENGKPQSIESLKHIISNRLEDSVPPEINHEPNEESSKNE